MQTLRPVRMNQYAPAVHFSLPKVAMSPVRIYIMHPAHPGSDWHVSEDGKEGESYRDGLVAMHAACNRARVLENIGMEVQVRQEDADGSWQVIRE